MEARVGAAKLQVLMAVIEAAAEIREKNPTLADPFGLCVCSVCRRLRAIFAQKGNDEQLPENLQKAGH